MRAAQTDRTIILSEVIIEDDTRNRIQAIGVTYEPQQRQLQHRLHGDECFLRGQNSPKDNLTPSRKLDVILSCL